MKQHPLYDIKVSRQGEVIWNGKTLRPYTCNTNPFVRFKDDGTWVTRTINKLVEETYLPLTPPKDLKQHPVFKDYYLSRSGEVYSSKRGPLRELTQLNNPGGYRRVILRHRGESIQKLVHILVVETFLGPVPTGSCVTHLDKDPTNNELDNLEVITKVDLYSSIY